MKAVQCLAGAAVWKAACDGVYSGELVAAAGTCIEDKTPGNMKTNCNNPVLFLLEYSDGLRAATLLLPGHLQGFGYAARVGREIHCTGFGKKNYQDHTFGYLGLNIQEMFLTGRPTYPVERTLLITGVLDALLESRYRNNARIETPQLNISYKSFVTPAIRYRGL